MKQISIGIDNWIEDVLKKIAIEQEKTLSEVAREILVKNLLEFKK